MKKLALLLLLAVIAAGCKPAEKAAAKKTATAPTGTEVGMMLPDYSATNIDGSKFDVAGRRG